jgi:O-antigen ligase
MLANPIAGRGTGSLERVYDEAFAEGDVAWRAFNAHNLPLNIGVAHGMVGLALFTTGVVAYVMAAFRRPVLARDSLVMVIVISGITEGVLEGPCIAVTLLGLVVGHVAARGPIDTPADHIELRRRARALRVRVGSLLPAR